LRLNEAAIKSTKAPASNYILLRDGEIPGFALRVTANDARAFVLTYTAEGRQRRLTIGAWPAWTATAARERAKELRRQIDNGHDPLEQKRERREAPTVEELAREYLERHAAKLKSRRILGGYIDRDILPVWGRWKAEDVRRPDVIEMVERKAKDTPIAGNMLLGVVRGLFNWAIEKDLLQHNPAFRVKPPASKKQRDRWLNEQEIRQFWTRLDTAKMEPECRSALRLILITAQRSGEVLSAERTEIDTDSAWWTIPAEKAKNGLQHSVPLPGLALEEIEKAKTGRWLIPSRYTSKGTHTTVAGLSNAVAANQEHFGLPRFTPHDLRRTAATHLTKTCGVPRFIVGMVLNHSEKGVTSVYDRYSYDPEKKAALQKWDRELRRILSLTRETNLVEIAG
jgi:integrase